MIGIYIWRERYIPFGMIVGEGTTAGGSRRDRGRERVRRRVGAGVKEVGECFALDQRSYGEGLGRCFALDQCGYGEKWGNRSASSRLD